MHVKAGMYVRCPLDGQLGQSRVFALGQVVRVDEYEGSIHVRFHDPSGIRKYYEDLPKNEAYPIDQVRRCKARLGTHVWYRGRNAQIVDVSIKTEQEYATYGITGEMIGNGIAEVSEKDLVIPLTHADYSPLDQMAEYELQNPVWYRNRFLVSHTIHILENAVYGFRTLAGCRVHLLPHQIATIIRCLSDRPCRYLLADEVGLGKTIEAAGILKILTEENRSLQSIVVVPRSLIDQWKTELLYKFKISVQDWLDYSRSDAPKTGRVVIASLEQVREDPAIARTKWDLSIVDEVHRLLKDGEAYSHATTLGQQSRNMLLLSATPVQDRNDEYLKLLALLNPDVYGDMTLERFGEVLEQQRTIQRRVYSLYSDMDDFSECASEIRDGLLDMADELEDKTLRELALRIDIDCEKSGKDQTCLCLAYLGEHYRFERRIIRNRREALRGDFAQRILEPRPYQMAGSDRMYYESDVYEELVRWIQGFLERHREPEARSVVETMLASFFSSPWAFSQKLREIDWPELDSVRDRTREWLNAAEAECERMGDLLDDPDLICGRLIRVLDYIDQELETTKMVVFTQFIETLQKLEDLVTRRLGKGSCAVFYRGLCREELKRNADRFQRDPGCRVMICDELGGEGRNFQIADLVIHVDIPWRADELEQRIGRLDRIGRECDRPVLSVVFFAEGTIEHQLFDLWNDGLDVFRQSLSGLEIVLGDLNEEISKALTSDVRHGLSRATEDVVEHSKAMRNAVREEQYFDAAAIIYGRRYAQLEQIVSRFRRGDTEMLHAAMMSWASMVGLRPSYQTNWIVAFDRHDFGVKSAVNALLVPPDWDRYQLDASLMSGDAIEGTFSRDVAIKREDLLFFSPGDPVFDSITDNAVLSARGRATAFAEVTGFSWKGLILAWSIAPNSTPLRRIGEDIRHMTDFRAYLPLEQIVTIYSLDESSERIDQGTIVQHLLSEPVFRSKRLVHLGSRGSKVQIPGLSTDGRTALEWFKSMYPPAEWRELIRNAYDDGLAEVQNRLSVETDLDGAEEEMRRIMSAHRCSSLYYGRDSERVEHLEAIYSAIMEGLRDPVITLDSMAFAWFVTANE